MLETVNKIVPRMNDDQIVEALARMLASAAKRELKPRNEISPHSPAKVCELISDSKLTHAT